MKDELIEDITQEYQFRKYYIDTIYVYVKGEENINLKGKIMKEKVFEFWFSKKSFVLLPYIGIRWDYEYELCVMWLCFNLSIVVNK
jgi:hypothetical protein